MARYESSYSSIDTVTSIKTKWVASNRQILVVNFNAQKMTFATKTPQNAKQWQPIRKPRRWETTCSSETAVNLYQTARRRAFTTGNELQRRALYLVRLKLFTKSVGMDTIQRPVARWLITDKLERMKVVAYLRHHPGIFPGGTEKIHVKPESGAVSQHIIRILKAT
jgi:hypothetical protein